LNKYNYIVHIAVFWLGLFWVVQHHLDWLGTDNGIQLCTTWRNTALGVGS